MVSVHICTCNHDGDGGGNLTTYGLGSFIVSLGLAAEDMGKECLKTCSKSFCSICHSNCSLGPFLGAQCKMSGIWAT